MSIEINIDDIIQMRKKHPCGSDRWRVVRLGVDIGLVCQGCQRRILLQRSKLTKQLKSISAAPPPTTLSSGSDS